MQLHYIRIIGYQHCSWGRILIFRLLKWFEAVRSRRCYGCSLMGWPTIVYTTGNKLCQEIPYTLNPIGRSWDVRNHHIESITENPFLIHIHRIILHLYFVPRRGKWIKLSCCTINTCNCMPCARACSSRTPVDRVVGSCHRWCFGPAAPHSWGVTTMCIGPWLHPTWWHLYHLLVSAKQFDITSSL